MSQRRPTEKLSKAQAAFVQEVSSKYAAAYASLTHFMGLIQNRAATVLVARNSEIHRTFRRRTKPLKPSLLNGSTDIDPVLGAFVRLATVGASVGLGLFWDRANTSVPMLYSDIACDSEAFASNIRSGLQNITSDLEPQMDGSLIWVTRPFPLEQFSAIDEMLESLLTSWLGLLRQAQEPTALDGDELPLQ